MNTHICAFAIAIRSTCFEMQAGTALVRVLHLLHREGALHLKPKAHYLAHVVYDLSDHWPSMNPWYGCTWRDEDFMGKGMKLVKAVDSRSVMTRPIEMYCAKLTQLLK